jgi:hypothetical protein
VNLAQTLAGETIVSIQDHGQFVFGQGVDANGNRNAPGSANIMPSNIDLIVIPDIMVTVATKFASSAVSFAQDIGDDNKK